MLWETYYDKLGDWSVSTAVSRISQLESFGSPAEITDAINQIGFDDETGATRLLKKAVGAGVKFTGAQLSELFLICDEKVLNHAVQFSADQFTTEDLDALYGFCDDADLVAIAKSRKLPLPEPLRDYEAPPENDFEENGEYTDPPLSPDALAAEYDYILTCLHHAHSLLESGLRLSLFDTLNSERTATVFKYACLTEAQPYIQDARTAWEALNVPDKDSALLQNCWLDISTGVMWSNYLFEGFLINLAVQRQIQKVMRRIRSAQSVIQNLRRALRAHM